MELIEAYPRTCVKCVPSWMIVSARELAPVSGTCKIVKSRYLMECRFKAYDPEVATEVDSPIEALVNVRIQARVGAGAAVISPASRIGTQAL